MHDVHDSGFGRIMQTMHFMQLMQVMQVMQNMQNMQNMQGYKIMQIIHFMQGGGSRGFQDGPLYGMIDKNHTGRAVG